MTNEEIIKQYRETSKESEKKNLLGILYTSNHSLINTICRPIAYACGESLEDLEQEAYFAVVKAADQYDEEQGNFSAYLILWIKAIIFRYIENNSYLIRIPSNKRHLIARYRRFLDEYFKEHGIEPSAQTICFALGIDKEQLRDLEMYSMSLKSLDAPIETEDGEYTLSEMLESTENVEGNVIANDSRSYLESELWKALSEVVTPAEMEILKMRFIDGKSFKEIADIVGWNEYKVRSGLQKLVRRLKKTRTVSDCAEMIEGLCYTKVGIERFRREHDSAVELAVMQIIGIR